MMDNVFEYLELSNIAAEIDEDVLKRIGSDCVNGYNEDLASRYEWWESKKQWIELAVQTVKEKNFPFPGASNVKFPLLTIAAIQFSSRAYPSLITAPHIVRGLPVGTSDEATQIAADVVGSHMSYQLLEEMEDWEEDHDKLLLVLPIVGTAFKKTYFDPDRGGNCSNLVMADELVVNYSARSLEKAARISQRMWFNDNEIVEKVRAGLWLDNDYSTNEAVGNNERMDSLGFSQSYEDNINSREFIEQHCWLDLDNDGYKEPYVVVVHTTSQKVVRIAPRFVAEDVATDSKGNIRKITPIQYYTNYTFIPDPRSNIYGLGLGDLAGPTNEAVNTLINQLIDSGKMSNMQAGFISKRLKVKNGDYNFRLGEWKQVDATMDELSKGIVPLPVREPSATLYNLLGFLVQHGQNVVSIQDVMLGKNPGQNQPYSTTMAVLEQGLKVYNGVYKRIYKAFKKELSKLFDLNARYLEDQTFFPTGQESLVVNRDFYTSLNIKIIPYADPSVVSETQEIAKTEALLPLVQMGAVNPQEVVRRLLIAQKQPYIEKLLQLPEQQPDPEVVLEQAKFQHQVEIDWADRQLEEIKVTAQTRRDEAASIDKLAQAEAREVGSQMDQYMMQLDTIKTQQDQFMTAVKQYHDMVIDKQNMEAATQQSATAGEAQ